MSHDGAFCLLRRASWDGTLQLLLSVVVAWAQYTTSQMSPINVLAHFLPANVHILSFSSGPPSNDCDQVFRAPGCACSSRRVSRAVFVNTISCCCRDLLFVADGPRTRVGRSSFRSSSRMPTSASLGTSEGLDIDVRYGW